MPVTNTQQARIEMSKAQAKAIGEICAKSMSTKLAIEETNLDGVLAVQTNGGMRLVHRNGEVYKLGGAAQAARTAQRKASRTK
jgi:hypothetical protein